MQIIRKSALYNKVKYIEQEVTKVKAVLPHGWQHGNVTEVQQTPYPKPYTMESEDIKSDTYSDNKQVNFRKIKSLV